MISATLGAAVFEFVFHSVSAFATELNLTFLIAFALIGLPFPDRVGHFTDRRDE